MYTIPVPMYKKVNAVKIPEKLPRASAKLADAQRPRDNRNVAAIINTVGDATTMTRIINPPVHDAVFKNLVFSPETHGIFQIYI